MYKQELTIIVKSIIASNTVSEQIESAQQLSRFYKKLTTYSHSDENETIVSGGIALSSSGAADCVEDYLRTVSFIKGIYKALIKLLNDSSEKKVNILYAGCGPYATLILPLLPLFDKERINAVLIDINASSLESVENLISTIDLREYNLQMIESNAITYNIPEDFIVDLAISETMHYALTREPQVAISRNIIRQLPSRAIFIPQEIRIDLAYSFFDYEPYLKKVINEVKGYKELQPYPNKVFVDRLFTINKEHFGRENHNSKIESAFYTLPATFENYPDLCLFTEITIYDDIELKTAESYITNPYCLVSLYGIQDYSEIKLIYDFDDIPKWLYQLK
ncbi:hypothetical protein [Flavobacterium sp. LHD-85]|uniref:hypothetical protein n=1 Tax=Flavobacterium sp. LHD-85 TaxID=3071410 RepID=UPI0027E02A26|nr:hypothetical protein [Flavobacterium sp. LHD-85]MDQ6530807.1 hypothetical protein [Flavobacterium sp. LHD-85]